MDKLTEPCQKSQMEKMTIYERSLLIFFAVTLTLQCFDFPGIPFLFVLSSVILIASYFFGGYLLFNSEKNERHLIPIFSGIAFSTSLFVFCIRIKLNEVDNSYFFLIPNELLFISLGVYLFIKRKYEIDFKPIKSIFMRSMILVILTSFFVYVPINFKPHRKIIYALNNGNHKLQSYLLMFDYTDIADEAYENGDYEKEIEYALKANKAGKDWLRELQFLFHLPLFPKAWFVKKEKLKIKKGLM